MCTSFSIMFIERVYIFCITCRSCLDHVNVICCGLQHSTSLRMGLGRSGSDGANQSINVAPLAPHRYRVRCPMVEHVITVSFHYGFVYGGFVVAPYCYDHRCPDGALAPRCHRSFGPFGSFDSFGSLVVGDIVRWRDRGTIARWASGRRRWARTTHRWRSASTILAGSTDSRASTTRPWRCTETPPHRKKNPPKAPLAARAPLALEVAALEPILVHRGATTWPQINQDINKMHKYIIYLIFYF